MMQCISYYSLQDSIRREVVYNILIEFGIARKLARLLKMCLNEICARVWVGGRVSDVFPINNGFKEGDALSSLLVNVSLVYAIKRVQVNQGGVKLNGEHQLLVYAADVNIFGGSVHDIKKNKEALVVARKEIGVEVKAEKSKYMALSRDQNAGRSDKERWPLKGWDSLNVREQT